LKYEVIDPEANIEVVPHVGTWIEMISVTENVTTEEVVPHVGTWIEIRAASSVSNITESCLT